MNDVGGSDSGTGLRAVKSSRTSDANFEYDDSEWDVGIGNLIIDLDADIEKNNEANRHSTSSVSSASNNLNPSSVSSNSNSPGNSSLPSGSTGNSSQMHIPHSSGTASGTPSNNASPSNNLSAGKAKSNTSALSTGGKTTAPAVANASDLSTTSMEHSAIVDKGLKMKIKRTKTGTKSGADAKHEIVKSDLVTSSSSSLSTNAGSNSNSNSSSGSSKSGSGGSTDSIATKSVHSSSSHKDKDKIKDSNMIMIDAERDSSGTSAGGNTNHNSSGSNTNNGIRDSGVNSEQGSKGKTPRKGSTHKKVKNSNGSGSSKKDERNNSNVTSSVSSDTKGSSSTTGPGGTHAKDGKDFFSTTVSLNVPTIIPNASSCFAKTTLKVPTATSSIPLNSQNSMQMHPSMTIDTSASPTSRILGHSSSSNSHWVGGSPSKAGEKGPVSSLCPVEKIQGSNSPSYGKKPRVIAPTDKASTNSEDGVPSILMPMASVNSSYRNASNSDLPSSCSISSSTNLQGLIIPNADGFPNSSKSSSLPQDPTLTQDICVGTSVGTVTEPDCLGACEPGTSVTLEGIVWHETEGGVLVVNVTWRGKTYVGTLLDCTKNDWAPPRFCDSPTSDLEMRIPKNRAKRGRGQTATPVTEVQADPRPGNAKLRNGAKGRRGSASNTAFVAPASPIKSEQWPKRKTRGSENEGQDEPAPKNAKKMKTVKEGDRKERKSSSPAPVMEAEKSGGPTSPVLIECPEPNCSKKYKHINGLRYHQSHAHNNFVAAEDSDSNASTTSTQLTTPTENSIGERLSSEPMIIDGTCDVDELDVPLPLVTTVEALTSTVKRAIASNGNLSSVVKPDEKGQDIHSESELKKDKESSEHLESPLSLIGKNSKNGKPQKEISTAAKDGDVKSSGDSINKDPLVSPIASRAPILTVPVPYISLQNRPLLHGHSANVPRTDASHGSRDQDSILMKPSPIGIVSPGNPSMLPSKGVPWQPHAHTSQIHSLNPTPGVHPHPNVTVPLNIPLSGNEKTSGKDKDRNSSTDSQGKKSKHKKKKDKDKEKSRSSESRGDSGKIHGGTDVTRSSGNMFSSNKTGDSGVVEGRRTESADDLRTAKRDDGINKNDSNLGMSGENRDDPQSPAYSDISDANDSGDTEINVGVVKEGCKNLIVPPDPKKETPGVGGSHSISSFYPSFYSPYLESNHSSKLGEKIPLPEDPDKAKHVKPTAPSHGQGIPPGNPQTSTNHPDEPGRSPKMDFHHPKYLPQQHFFHYPYSNYHFDQGQYNNMMPENTYNSTRNFGNVDEREKEREMMGDHHAKGKLPDKDNGPVGPIIKQEPGERSKDGRPPGLGKPNPEEKRVEVKSEFGLDYSEPKSSVPHFMNATCSKHSKEAKRDGTNKSDSMGSIPSCDKPLSKDIPSVEHEKDLKDREREREKNEGSKPTMETQGPPPPPTAGSYAYIPQPYLQGNPFGLHFDPGHPLYRQVLVPGPYGGSPYMHPGSIPRFQPPPGATPLPEDLSRPNTSSSGSASNKALDLLQHHAAQYYNVHKIHELSELPLRSSTLKSPNPQVNQRDREPPTGPPPTNTPSTPGGPNVGSVAPNPRSGSSSTNASAGIPKPADLSKDSKIGIIGATNDSSRSPPTQHHVHSHTHHHTHVGIGYPIIPAFPAPHSPHYGVLPTTPAAASVIPPFPSQKPN